MVCVAQDLGLYLSDTHGKRKGAAWIHFQAKHAAETDLQK